MGVIDINTRAILARARKLHPAAHAGQLWQHMKHIARRAACGNHQGGRKRHIFRLKAANKVQMHLIGRALPVKPQVLTLGVKALAQNAQIAALAMANRDQALPACHRDIGDIDAARIVHIDHGGAIFGQNPIKQRGFGGEIGVKGVVIVQMVLGKVGEPRRAQAHPVQTALVQPVRRGLHRGMGHAIGGGKCQHLVQGDRVGRGMRRGRAPGAFHPGGANVDRRLAQRHPDLPRKGRDRGFAIGARHRNHRRRLRAKP